MNVSGTIKIMKLRHLLLRKDISKVIKMQK